MIKLSLQELLTDAEAEEEYEWMLESQRLAQGLREIWQDEVQGSPERELQELYQRVDRT